MTILVTGGAGFIGSNFVKYLTDRTDEHVVVVDKLTYAADLKYLRKVPHSFVEADIGDTDVMSQLLLTFHPRGIINFAAETHVDRSISKPAEFLKTNVMGTHGLLEAVRYYLKERHTHIRNPPSFRFHHISTDEVYGSLAIGDPASTESSLYAPRSPYSASKAASDHLVASYGATYGISYVITNCSNNYGPHQNLEKLIPTVISRGLDGNNIPMYADGANIRDWIHVNDHCDAIWRVFVYAKDFSKYNIGGNNQITNKEVITTILNMIGVSLDRIKSVPDRPGHDFRYDIDCSKINRELQWKPSVDFEDGLKGTIEWYHNELHYDNRNHLSCGTIDSAPPCYLCGKQTASSGL